MGPVPVLAAVLAKEQVPQWISVVARWGRLALSSAVPLNAAVAVVRRQRERQVLQAQVLLLLVRPWVAALKGLAEPRGATEVPLAPLMVRAAATYGPRFSVVGAVPGTVLPGGRHAVVA